MSLLDDQINSTFPFLKHLVLHRNDFSKLTRVGDNPVFPLRYGMHVPTKKNYVLKTLFDADLNADDADKCLTIIQKIAAHQTSFFSELIGFCYDTDLILVYRAEKFSSLAERIYNKKEKKLNSTELTMVAYGIARAIEELHSKGLCHGDLKVSNVIIDDKFFPIITDLGLDDFLLVYMKLREYKRPHGFYPYYYAPERLSGAKLNASMDIYSYGLILYEMAEKKTPFDDCNSFQSLKNALVHKTFTLTFSPSTPQLLKALIRKCMSIDPQHRPDIKKVLTNLKQGANFGGSIKQGKIEKYNAALKNKQRQTQPSKVPLPSNSNSSRIRKNSIPKPAAKKDSESELSNIDILKIPTHPKFISVLYSIEKDLDNANLNALLPLIFDHVGSSKVQYDVKCEILESIIQILMNSNVEIAKLFIDHKVISKIPDNDKYRPFIIEFVAQIIHKFPDLINKEFLPIFDKFSYIYPEVFLVLISLYVKQIDRIVDPWAVIDYLISYGQKISDISEKIKIIDIYVYLYKNFASFTERRLQYSRNFIFNCLKSEFPEVVNEALTALILIGNLDETKDDISGIIDVLNSADNGEKAAALLMQYKTFSITSQFLQNCISLSRKSEKAWDLLLKSVIQPQNQSTFLNNACWLEAYESNPVSVFRVFLALYSPEKRQQLSKMSLYPHLLNAIINSDSQTHISVLTSVVRRGYVDKDLVGNLSYNGFLKIFIKKACDSNLIEVKHNCMVLIDSFAHLSYSQDYLAFLPQFSFLLANQQCAPLAVQAMVTLSYYKQCVMEFVKMGMREYFTQLNQIPAYQSLAGVFLSNINRFT